MKKIIQLMCIGLIIVISSCESNDSNKNEINPLALLGMLGLVGNSSLTVTATYNGTETAEIGATGKIYVYLYKSIGLTTRDPKPVYKGSTGAAVTSGTPATITINNIRDGEYYVLVFYDYHYGEGNVDNQNDRYVLYDSTENTAFTGVATKFTVSGDSVLNGISFGDMYKLEAGSKYIESSKACSLAVTANYTGTTNTTGTGRMFVYLYDTLGSNTRTPTPLMIGSTSTAATSGTITINNIVAGNYYVVVFYDYSDDGSGHFDSQGDRYILYNNKQFAGQADPFMISAGNNTLGGVSFGNSYTLQSGSAYMSVPVDLTVNTTYTGTAATTGSGKIFVYLYNTLGRGTRLSGNPIYSGSTAATPGNPATITISGVDQGNYYVVIFYDYKLGTDVVAPFPANPNDDSPDDRYIIYNGKQYPADASAVSLTSNTTLNAGSFGDSYTFQANILSNALFMQTGSLTVHATYTGAAPVATIGSRKIFVYLYDSLNATTPTSGGTRDPLPIYTGSTAGSLNPGDPGDITINNILPGNYYMVVFYDFRSGTNPDNQTDPYIIYNNVAFPYDGASTVPISIGSEVSGISFDYSNTLTSGGAFN